jgi:hypothetical protein
VLMCVGLRSSPQNLAACFACQCACLCRHQGKRRQPAANLERPTPAEPCQLTTNGTIVLAIVSPFSETPSQANTKQSGPVPCGSRFANRGCFGSLCIFLSASTPLHALYNRFHGIRTFILFFPVLALAVFFFTLISS